MPAIIVDLFIWSVFAINSNIFNSQQSENGTTLSTATLNQSEHQTHDGSDGHLPSVPTLLCFQSDPNDVDFLLNDP